MLSPLPGSQAELARFGEIQALLPDMFRKNQADPRREQTVVVIPSLSLDERELAKVTGVHHYEERMLFFLMLLRHPRLRLIFVTSQAISPVIVDYYLHLLSGIPASHARKRLMLFECADGSELERFVRCGDPEEGFAWLVCEGCAHHRLVPLSWAESRSTPISRTGAVR